MAADQVNIVEKKQRIMEAGFDLFSEKGIEAVTMRDIMEASGVPNTSRFRYFPRKLDVVIAIGVWKWKEYIDWHNSTVTAEEIERMTAAEYMRWYLDSFIDLYRNHSDMLRFNYTFNSFVRSNGATPEMMKPYLDVVERLRSPFHDLYEKGRQDGTINLDISEEEMLSSSFHIMLAAATRYAVGLMYESANPENELVRLKDMLLQEFTKQVKTP